MFIRWKGRYAYLERRFKDKDGKVISRSRYLGQNHLTALEKMVADGEINENEFKLLVGFEPEGILKPTGDGGLGIRCGTFGLLPNTRIAVFFNGKWLQGTVVRDNYGWFLKDENGHKVGLCPGVKARQLF